MHTVAALLAARVARDPDRPAWWISHGDDWASVSWREFDGRVARLAGALRSMGIRRGERVVIMARSSLSWEVADHAILRLGAVVVGIDPHAAPGDRAAILAHAHAVACIVDDPAAVDALPAPSRASLRHILAIDAAPEDAPPLPASETMPVPDDVATLVYTSGTTGVPKAIAFTHRQIRNALTATLEVLGPISSTDRGVSWLPLASMFQRMMNLVSIAVGGQTWFVEEPRALMERLPQIRPTILIGVPRLFEKVEQAMRERIANRPVPARLLGRAAFRIAAAERAPAALRSLADRLVLRRVRDAFGGDVRFMVSGSAPLAADTMRFFDSCRLPILEAYGLSECVTPVACNQLGARRIGSVGRPLRGNEVQIAPDGEVMLKSPGLFADYVDSAAETARFDADGFYATGDCGHIDRDGYLFLTGRKRDIIKTSGGRQVVPARIEAGLRRLVGADVAVALAGARAGILAVLSLDRAATGADEATIAARIRVGVAALNGELAHYERVCGCIVVLDGLTMAAGHLTSSLKPRRAVIAESWRKEIDELATTATGGSGEVRVIFVP